MIDGTENTFNDLLSLFQKLGLFNLFSFFDKTKWMSTAESIDEKR